MAQSYTGGAPQARTDIRGVARIATLDEMIAGESQDTMATPFGVAEYVAQKAGSANVESGSWTPTFSFATPGNLTVSYSLQFGRYTRIGDMVYVTLRLGFTPTHTTASGNATVSLPFTAMADQNQIGLNVFTNNSVTWPTTNDLTGVPLAGSATMQILSGATASVGTNWGTTQFPTATARTLFISGWYKSSVTAGRTATFLTAVTTGSFTPTATFVTPGTLSVAYTVQTGTYVRIGSLVFVTLRMDFTPTLGTASGDFRVGGLPFTVSGPDNPVGSVVSASSITYPASNTYAVSAFVVGTTQLGIRGAGSGTGGATWGTTQIPNATARNVYVSGCYYTDDVTGSGTSQQIREVLTASRTYYVATTGSDTDNDGLSASTPFLTVQKAVDVVTRMIDRQSYSVTIQLANGTYAGAITLAQGVGSSNVTIQGNVGSPSSVILTHSSTTIGLSFVPSSWIISNVRIASTGGYGIYASGLGNRITLTNCQLGSVTESHIGAFDGALVYISGNCEVVGGAKKCIFCGSGGQFGMFSGTWTMTGTPAFSEQFCYVYGNSFVQITGVTFSGSATGTRYGVVINGSLYVNGAGANYLPGNAAGSTATGGQYV